MPELLLELFSEEIPARMQADAAEHLRKELYKQLGMAGLIYIDDWNEAKIDHTFVTPRRLAIHIWNILPAQPDSTLERKGPRADAPEAAIQGFLKSTGLTLDKLENRGGVYFAVIEQKGKPTPEILKLLIEEILAKFPWPKSMRWGAESVRWVRPLKSILCVFDGAVVPVTFGPVTAADTSYGHRFLAPEPFKATTFAQYQAELSKRYVVLDRETRKQEILKKSQALAGAKGCTLKEDAKLLEEVTGLVEWPVPLLGNIAPEFMNVPAEALITAMREHQKYFSLVDAAGKMAPYFITVANMEAQGSGADSGAKIIAGNERVLRARLSDARFFWEQDTKSPLDSYLPRLETLVFHAKLGSVADKIARMKTLIQTLEADPKAARAAELSKADLMTGMVGEFPELQGVMGYYYALEQGEAREVAEAIRDQYKPLGPNDSVPTEPLSRALALADKIDTLSGMFAVGEKPTGSKDPFGLRRAALGIIRIILENNLRISFADLAFSDEVTAFVSDRLKVILKDQGIRHDLIDAVSDNDITRLVTRVKILQEFLSTEEGKNLLAVYKRAVNILAIEEKKDGKSYSFSELEHPMLKEESEIALAKLLDEKEPVFARLQAEERFAESVQLLAELRAPIDAFFATVRVNCDDANLRANRLRLLSHIRNAIGRIADFSKIEG